LHFYEASKHKRFLRTINRWHPYINFTPEHEIDDKLAFLDVLVIHDNKTDKYISTVYRKLTNTSLHLLYDSIQCRKYKLGSIRTLVIRILLICSTSTHKDNELTLMKETLKKNRYPQHLIRRRTWDGEAIVNKMLNNTNNKQQNSAIKNNIFLTLTYYELESDVLAQRIRKICHRYLPLVNFKTAFRKTFTVKNIFLPIQKGVDETEKG
jgi:hypothetical protein